MLEKLHDAIEELPYLMEDKSRWNSLHVTYAQPRVERLWTQFGENRILLHRIYPCEQWEALYHAHPWPSAVRVVRGKYEMGLASFDVGAGIIDYDDWHHGPTEATLVLTKGCEYEMINRTGWHYVRPVDGPCDTIMVVGPPFKNPMTGQDSIPDKKQNPLIPTRFDELFNEWKMKFD